MTPELYDRVVLIEDIEAWPAGTTATVVEQLPDGSILAEFVGPDGRTLDLLDLPASAVEVVERHPVLA